jgi:glyoxylase-like metal-dependent hydrolase (beta-lactamase superfamily II)
MHPRLKQFALAALVASGAAAFIAAPVQATAPMVKTPAPGYFRIMLGEFEITPVSDGTLELAVDKLLNEQPAKIAAALGASYLQSPLETSVNAYLINTGSKLVLVDTGSGAAWGPTLGKFVANLKAAGYQPEQIDEIYLTHFHGDHIGGLVSNGQPVFPNAIVRADKQEADFWLSKANMDQAPQAKKGSFQAAMTMLDPYVKAGKFKPFDADAELVPGITSHAAKGHTPGHTTYVVESRGQKLVLVGDLIHVAAVQMDDPAVTIGFDADQKAAAAARKKEFDAAAKDGSLIGGTHLQFPGLGHLVSGGKGYRWIPVNYTQIR